MPALGKPCTSPSWGGNPLVSVQTISLTVHPEKLNTFHTRHPRSLGKLKKVSRDSSTQKLIFLRPFYSRELDLESGLAIWLPGSHLLRGDLSTFSIQMARHWTLFSLLPMNTEVSETVGPCCVRLNPPATELLQSCCYLLYYGSTHQ